MTDGQGNTVYFSETIIIFTSNLGIYGTDSNGERVLRVTPQMPYEEVQKSVRKGIEDYFKLQLGRPEILNRIGENIVVFDFIREDVADLILKAQVNKIISNLQTEKKISVSLSETAMEVLRTKAVGNLDNGGRGIGNIVESLLINPLSRYLFDNEIFENKTVVIEDINAEIQPYSLICAVS
jgi:ATP-dependent Clp protease ATP-binding subunit ClpA